MQWRKGRRALSRWVSHGRRLKQLYPRRPQIYGSVLYVQLSLIENYNPVSQITSAKSWLVLCYYGSAVRLGLQRLSFYSFKPIKCYHLCPGQVEQISPDGVKDVGGSALRCWKACLQATRRKVSEWLMASYFLPPITGCGYLSSALWGSAAMYSTYWSVHKAWVLIAHCFFVFLSINEWYTVVSYVQTLCALSATTRYVNYLMYKAALS